MGSANYITALHLKSSQFTPSCGHWNLQSLTNHEHMMMFLRLLVTIVTHVNIVALLSAGFSKRLISLLTTENGGIKIHKMIFWNL